MYKKIGILTNIPNFYRSKMWEAYSKIDDIKLDIFYCNKSEYGRKWRYYPSNMVNEYFLKGHTIFNTIHINFSIIKYIKDYDIWIIGGYGSPTVLLTISICILTKKPYIILIDGIPPQKIIEKKGLIYFIKKMIFNYSNSILANGEIGRQYVSQFNIDNDKIFNQYLTIDIDYYFSFSKDKDKIRKLCRDKYKIPQDAFLALYVGRLIKNKGVQDLILAHNKLLKEYKNVYLFVVGDGDYENELKSIATKNVIFTGHINEREVYKYYYSSDIFVLPTYSDYWGLVINEAMACGLPILSSKNAGASLDLIKDNGYLFDPHNVDQIQKLMEKYYLNDELIKKQGYNSKCLIKQYSFENARKQLEYSIIKSNK